MTVLVRMDVCTSWSTRFFRFSGHCLFASQANGCIQTCPSCSLTSGSTKNTSPGQLAVSIVSVPAASSEPRKLPSR